MHGLCLAVGQIYYTRNLTFIGPFLFSTTLVKWSLHGFKSLHTLDGCSYPSGSVTTLQKFLQSSQDEDKCFESGDVEVWADNTKKGKDLQSSGGWDNTYPRKFKMAILRKLTFLLAGFQWEIYEKLIKIRRLHGIVTCVLHTQFT